MPTLISDRVSDIVDAWLTGADSAAGQPNPAGPLYAGASAALRDMTGDARITWGDARITNGDARITHGDERITNGDAARNRQGVILYRVPQGASCEVCPSPPVTP